MKKIVIINGHPDAESYCHALQANYKKGALAAGNEVKEIILADMDFSPNLKYGYRKRTEWETDLTEAWEKILWADHLVWIYPTWWGTVPAILKGFIDRTFLPGIAFEYDNKSPFPKQLLKGRTSEIITTMDTPVWYYKLIFKNIGVRFLRKNVGNFCGIKNRRTTYLTTIKKSTPEIRAKWLTKIEKLGQQ